MARFAPPLLLMGLIFFLSAQPDLNSGLGTWDTVLRKIAHVRSSACCGSSGGGRWATAGSSSRP